MSEQEFSFLKEDLKKMIDFLRNRGIKIGEIVDSLQEKVKLPKRWSSTFKYIDALSFSKVNIDVVSDIHNQLSSKIRSILLYDNKLVKVINLDDQSFDSLLGFYKDSVTETSNKYSINQLIDTSDTNVSFYSEIDDRKIAFHFKSIVSDDVKFDIEDRVNKELRDEFSNIIGLKKIDLPSLNSYIFDINNKVVIISVDLSGIIKSSNLNVEMSRFSIDLKKSVQGANFPSNSRNLFGKIKDFYDERGCVANDLSLKTADGVIYHVHANAKYPDARESTYHKTGVKGVNGLINLFRIFMTFNTTRKTQYKIDLKSNAAMATKKVPVLYEAMIKANNAADFSDAINKIL